jgi:DNA-binding NarL/FixJ family response regulator
MVKVVLVDDHKIFRQGLRVLLESEPDIKVIGEAANGDDGAIMVHELKPDILVADIRMPGLTGIQLSRAARESSPNTATIVLSMFGDEVYALEALEAGAMGYVVKESSFEELILAVREALASRYFISQTLDAEGVMEKWWSKTEGIER